MKIAVPRHLVLEVTRKCNFHCPFCYCVWHEFPALVSCQPKLFAKTETLAPRNLPTREWRQILDHLLANGAEELLFSGGEALLRPDLRELLLHARRRAPDCRLSLFTNGSRMDEEWLRFCRRHRIHLSTSLPGIASYREMTGSRRSFRRILELIARARELRWPVNVSLTASRLNCEEFVRMFCAAALAGAATIQAGPVMAAGRARENPGITISREQWEELKQQLRALPDTGVPYAFCDEMVCECRPNSPEVLLAFGRPEQSPCAAGRDYGVIGPSGYFRDCMHTVENRCRWRELVPRQ